MAQSSPNRQNLVYSLLIAMIGMNGCLTIAVILASVFGGLWLDKVFDTKPVFTLVLLFAGIPVSLFLMVYAARKTLARLKTQDESKNKLGDRP